MSYDFKEGDKVIKIISGAGVETASLRTVVAVNESKGLAYCDLDDLADDGQNTYRLDTGRASVCWIPGFSHRIIPFEE